ncbi:putative LRR receptor-like serine/threonine-protein kinase [Iris pallida]|uniref:non-specific serine/threonine protein kinase n=1 Tax=Iris pallida TaxID=29817 RepID=A0AAX6H628_IRIPA|nr:putative LRR receptor-like serine/threonine-protein kinase [Iris pallida]
MDAHAFLFAGNHCLLFFLVLLLHALILFSATLDNSTDLSSLLAFKAASTTSGGGDPSDNIIATNWTTDAPFCTWVGVRCSRRRPRVVSLNLSSFSLQGTISPHLSNLSFLSSLDLTNNSLSGTIPDALARLPRLAMLLLGRNLLSGPIPPSIFNMSSLVSIVLFSNNLSGSLRTQVLLPRIETISIWDNMLTGHIPADLARCSTLQRIDLHGNKLTGSVPSTLGNLSELVVLSLGQNQLNGVIPASIGNLAKLRNLFLGYNGLEGEIPKEVGNLVNLQFLNLQHNGIAGAIPISLWNASKMILLSLTANNLTGPVPAILGKSMPFLQILCMGENALSGGLDFVASLTNCRDLNTIEVGVNQFEGVLSEACRNLSMNLQYFYLNENNIKGRIPTGLGNLSSLIMLALSNNELRGTIPWTLWRLKKLQMMYLGRNRLTGSIPSYIGQMTNLATISLTENEFSGQIPDSVGNISMLQHLDLSVNKLSSTIPLSLWSLTGLVTLDLSQNSFDGFLPPQMAKLKAIDAIDLSSNRLSGNISSALGELQSITYLDLSNNSLHGQIPQHLGRLFNVKYLNLSHNFFFGFIPKSFSNLSNINRLDLSFNMLEGEIPEGKVFSNVNITSLMENRALCGAPQLKFPPCPANVTTSTSCVKLRLLKYVLPSIASTLVFLSCFSLFVKKFMRKKANTSFMEESPCLNYHRRIPYFELARATDNFSEANLLGRGSIGKVYKGSLDDGLPVAVKVLNLEVEGASRSFDAECRTLGQVRHRNLVKIISTCSNLEFMALVLEFMPNLSLDKWLYSQNQCLTLLQRINIMLDVSLGLDYLHHQHPHVIVHCDLKPSNILLDENMVAKISDFGIAKLMLIDNKSTTNNIGTVGYMAPEYGSTGGVTIRGDVYSFGILVLELVTGKKPVDTMFNGKLNLRQWVCNAYPTAVMEIVDSNILRTKFTNLQQHSDRVNILHRCLSSFIEVGLHCSKDLPNERLLMKDVVPRLQEIKNGVLVNSKDASSCAHQKSVSYP